MTTQEEAKYWRDKFVLETLGPKFQDGTLSSKASAVIGAGIDPENFDKINGQPQEEADKIAFGKCYEGILSVLDSYMDLPEDEKKIVAIWILGTYLHETFPTFPFLFLNAMRGSGKTRLLKIISHLAHKGNGMVSTQPTDAVMFRTPKHHTLTFDEFENIGSKDKANFRLYLNASYKSGGVVQRTKKIKKNGEENFEIETFEPYKPIAMANIWGMEEVVEDRCLTLILQKSNNPAKTKKIEDFDTNYTIKELKRTLEAIKCSLCSVVMQKQHIQRWNSYIDLHYTLTTYTTLTTLTTLQEELFNKINNANIDGRNLELIFPLLITATMLNMETFDEMLAILTQKIKSKKEEELAESKDVCFIDFVASSFDQGQLSFISVKDLTNHFKAYMNEIDELEEKWLNSKWVGRALKRLDLISDKRRLSRGMEVTLNIFKAKEKLKMFKKENNSYTSVQVNPSQNTYRELSENHMDKLDSLDREKEGEGENVVS